MVHELQLVGARVLRLGFETILAEVQPLHQTDEGMVAHVLPERGRHVVAVERDGHVVELRAGRHCHKDQHIATAQLVRPIRERHDLQLVRRKSRGDAKQDGKREQRDGEEGATGTHGRPP